MAVRTRGVRGPAALERGGNGIEVRRMAACSRGGCSWIRRFGCGSQGSVPAAKGRRAGGVGRRSDPEGNPGVWPFRPRTKVAERRDDGSQGLQPLDPVLFRRALKGRTSLRDANLKTHASRGRCPRLPSSCRSATPENGQTPGHTIGMLGPENFEKRPNSRRRPETPQPCFLRRANSWMKTRGVTP